MEFEAAAVAMNASASPAAKGSEPLDPALAALKGEFIETVRSSVERARELLSEAFECPDGNLAMVQDIFHMVHDLKGQGLTLGFPAVTRIGASLCDYVRFARKPLSAEHLTVIGTHLKALEFVMTAESTSLSTQIWDQPVPKLDELIRTAGQPARSRAATDRRLRS